MDLKTDTVLRSESRIQWRDDVYNCFRKSSFANLTESDLQETLKVSLTPILTSPHLN